MNCAAHSLIHGPKSGSYSSSPQILATYRINRYFAVGVGVYGPNSIGRHES